MKDYDALARRVAAQRNVKAVAPFILGPVLVETEPPNGQSQVGAPWIRASTRDRDQHQRAASSIVPDD